MYTFWLDKTAETGMFVFLYRELAVFNYHVFFLHFSFWWEPGYRSTWWKSSLNESNIMLLSPKVVDCTWSKWRPIRCIPFCINLWKLLKGFQRDRAWGDDQFPSSFRSITVARDPCTTTLQNWGWELDKLGRNS